MGKWGSPEDRAIITDTSGRLSRDRDSDRIHMRGGQQTRAVSKDLETREVTTRGNDTDNRPEDRVGNISREEAGYKETEQEIALNTEYPFSGDGMARGRGESTTTSAERVFRRGQGTLSTTENAKTMRGRGRRTQQDRNRNRWEPWGRKELTRNGWGRGRLTRMHKDAIQSGIRDQGGKTHRNK